MNSKELYENYNANKDKFHQYIKSVKNTMKVDIYSLINSTIIRNPYNTEFPRKFFSNNNIIENKIVIFLKSCCKFYLKLFYSLFVYVISFVLFRIYYKKNRVSSKSFIGIDVFFLVDNINKSGKFNENYFEGLYEVLDKYNENYVFFPRLYGMTKNPFKLIKLIKIINKDKRNFLFEFELLAFKDFISIFLMILMYPFKTMRLLQSENSDKDKLFNNELIKDITSVGLESFSRYIFGQNISQVKNISRIFSWSEFQVVERSFNFGIRTHNESIKLYGCQLFLNYETYFNSCVDELDVLHRTAFHKILVNGKYYILDNDKLKYGIGVSLRYKSIFEFKGIKEEKNILVLGSYIEEDTKNMLASVRGFENIIFKNHPAVSLEKLGKLPENITVSNKNIYELFENAQLVIGTASGTCLEAVACGMRVIIVASAENLTANPLVDYGKGKIWDIAFSENDVKRLYNALIKYSKNNSNEIQNITTWYKENFFIKPTEENIIKTFELNKGR